MSALKNMDRWLNLFYITLEEKAGYCMERSEAFAKEYDFEFDERDEKLEEMELPVENLKLYCI